MYGLVRQWATISGNSPLVTQPFFDEAATMACLRDSGPDLTGSPRDAGPLP
jgi:hypothetical protein